MRARYYDPATAQFLSRDPLVAETSSAYGYVDGNPLNYTDPSGLCASLVSWWNPFSWGKNGRPALTPEQIAKCKGLQKKSLDILGGGDKHSPDRVKRWNDWAQDTQTKKDIAFCQHNGYKRKRPSSRKNSDTPWWERPIIPLPKIEIPDVPIPIPIPIPISIE